MNAIVNIIETLIPICVMCVLPIMVVWLITRARVKKNDQKMAVLLKAYLSFERFQGRSRFSTWLFRIAYNCWYDQLQNYPDNESVDLQEVRKLEDEGSTADKKYEYQQLYAAIRSLTRQE